jgi:bifunctional DNase/RNase
MTHDLAAGIIKKLDAQVEQVIITDLQENTFFAVICISRNGSELQIDSRPSDALAIAVRLKCPVYVRKHIADKMADELDDIFDRLQPKATVH